MRLPLLAALTLTASCNSSSDLTVRLALSQNCQLDACSQYPVNCSATALLRIVDPASGDVLASHCQAVSQGNLCALGNLSIEDSGIPTGPVMVQAALWNTNHLDSGACPTGVLFDGTGAPLPQWPPVAFGGSAVVQAGDTNTFTLDIHCNSPPSLDSACSTPSLSAEVNRLATNLSVDQTAASSVQVLLAEPTVNGFGMGVVDAPETMFPVLPSPARPLWQVTPMTPPIARSCIIVRSSGPSTITCQPTGTQEPLLGTFLDTTIEQQVLSALGSTSFDTMGIIIGIVLSDIGAPVSGATVTSSSGTVEYVTDGGGLSTTATESSGLFIATDATYDTTWQASAMGISSDNAVAGLVTDHVSTLTLQLQH